MLPALQYQCRTKPLLILHNPLQCGVKWNAAWRINELTAIYSSLLWGKTYCYVPNGKYSALRRVKWEGHLGFYTTSNFVIYKGVSKSFRTQSLTKYTLTTINTRWEAAQRVMAAKLTTLTHKIAIQLHLVAEICNICSYRTRRPVWKLSDTPSFTGLKILL
jgi:hypothetical protein